jgi:hypothetical protein
MAKFWKNLKLWFYRVILRRSGFISDTSTYVVAKDAVFLKVTTIGGGGGGGSQPESHTGAVSCSDNTSIRRPTPDQ